MDAPVQSNGAAPQPLRAPDMHPPAVPAYAAPNPPHPVPPVAALPSPAAKRGVPRPLRVLLVLALVGGLGFGAYTFLSSGKEDTDAAQITSDMVAVATRVAGQVLRVHIVENQVVKKGDLIAELDSADYAARLKQAEAELATAQAQAAAADAQVKVVDATSRGGLMSARALLSGSAVGVGSAEAQVSAAQATLLRSQAEARKAKIDLERTRELRAANAVPQERLDTAQIAYDAAQAALAQGQAQVAVARESKEAARTRVREAKGRLSQSEPIDAQLAGARAGAELAHARVRSAEAMLELAKLQLSYTRIVAPADGIASKLSAREGQLLSVGQPVVEVVPLAVYVTANFKETQVGHMKPGQRAVIHVDAYPGRALEGRVESLAGGTGASFALLPADNATGNFVKVVQRVPVRIALVNPPGDLMLRAGLSAEVEVQLAGGR